MKSMLVDRVYRIFRQYVDTVIRILTMLDTVAKIMDHIRVDLDNMLVDEVLNIMDQIGYGVMDYGPYSIRYPEDFDIILLLYQRQCTKL